MLIDSRLDSLKSKLESLGEYNKVVWGREFPTSIRVDDFPAVFIQTGRSDCTFFDENKDFREEQVVSIYIMVYSENDQETALKDLTSKELEVTRKVLYELEGWVNSEFVVDRDTTFIKLGVPFNYLPPYFCSRLDFTLIAKGGK